MERRDKTLSIADVAGWGSALATFGLIQGALYLQGYWGRFGLDPFQFVAVSELALAGLAGIGFVLLLMLFAALLGSWLEGKISDITPERKLLRWLVAVAFVLTIGALVWWVNGWIILAGGFLTVGCLVVIALSPVVPAGVKESPWLSLIMFLVVYVSIASSWLGSERAKKIVKGEGNNVSTITVEGETLSSMTLIGRLGDTYALWDPAGKATLLLPATDFKKLRISRRDAVVAPSAPRREIAQPQN